jgi:hypothetical protein
MHNTRQAFCFVLCLFPFHSNENSICQSWDHILFCEQTAYSVNIEFTTCAWRLSAKTRNFNSRQEEISCSHIAVGISCTNLTYFPTKTYSYNLVYKIFIPMYLIRVPQVEKKRKCEVKFTYEWECKIRCISCLIYRVPKHGNFTEWKSCMCWNKSWIMLCTGTGYNVYPTVCLPRNVTRRRVYSSVSFVTILSPSCRLCWRNSHPR